MLYISAAPEIHPGEDGPEGGPGVGWRGRQGPWIDFQELRRGRSRHTPGKRVARESPEQRGANPQGHRGQSERRIRPRRRRARQGAGGEDPPADYRGTYYKEWAWEARGKGFADTVSPENAQKFHDRLEQADKALREAWRSTPSITRSRP